MYSKVDPEQPLLAGWLQSCKCPLWLCPFCTCLGPAVTQELSRAILLGMAEYRGTSVPLGSHYNHSQWSSGQTGHPQHSYETWDVHGQNLGDANIWFPMKHRKKSRLILKNYLIRQHSETPSHFVTSDGIKCSIDSMSNAVMIEIKNYKRSLEMD